MIAIVTVSPSRGTGLAKYIAAPQARQAGEGVVAQIVFTTCAPDCIVVVYTRGHMPATGTKTRSNRDETINLRASQRQKALIDRAADALGRNRSDFMLETACREAEAVLLDRRYFALSTEEFKRFTTMLDKPPANNPGLRRLLKTKAPWEQSQ
jgi:uncharacterized protein (DUF1778 family)